MGDTRETCTCGAEWIGPSTSQTDRQAFRDAHAHCRARATLGTVVGADAPVIVTFGPEFNAAHYHCPCGHETVSPCDDVNHEAHPWECSKCLVARKVKKAHEPPPEWSDGSLDAYGHPTGKPAHEIELLDELLKLILDDMAAAKNADLAADGPVGGNERNVWEEVEAKALELSKGRELAPRLAADDLSLRERVDLHELADDERREIEGELFALVDGKGYPVVRHGAGDPQPCWPCTVSLLVDSLPVAGATLAPLLAFCVAWNAMSAEDRYTAADYISGEQGTADDRREDLIAAFGRALPVLQDHAVDKATGRAAPTGGPSGG